MWGTKKRHRIISIIPDCGTLHPGASLSFSLSLPLSTSKAQGYPAGPCVAGMALACQNHSLVWVKGGGRVNGDRQSTDRNSWSTKGACLTDLPAPSPAAPQNCSVTMRPWCCAHKHRINKPPADKGYSYIKPLLQCGCLGSAPAHGANKRPALESVTNTRALNTNYYMSQTKRLSSSTAKSTQTSFSLCWPETSFPFEQQLWPSHVCGKEVSRPWFNRHVQTIQTTWQKKNMWQASRCQSSLKTSREEKKYSNLRVSSINMEAFSHSQSFTNFSDTKILTWPWTTKPAQAYLQQ